MTRKPKPEPPAPEPNVINEVIALLDNQPAYVLAAVRDWIAERLSK